MVKKILTIILIVFSIQLYSQVKVIDNKGTIKKVNRVSKGVWGGATHPQANLNPTQGDIHFDTGNNVVKIFDGTNWVIINQSTGTADYQNEVTDKHKIGTFKKSTGAKIADVYETITRIDAVTAPNSMASRTIATYKNENQTNQEIKETITKLSNTTAKPYVYTYKNENGNGPTFDVGKFPKTITTTGTHKIAKVILEDNTEHEIKETITQITQKSHNVKGNNKSRNIATYTNEEGTPTNIRETITQITQKSHNVKGNNKSRNIATYKNENGDETTIRETITEMVSQDSGGGLERRQIAKYVNENNEETILKEGVTNMEHLPNGNNNDSDKKHTIKVPDGEISIEGAIMKVNNKTKQIQYNIRREIAKYRNEKAEEFPIKETVTAMRQVSTEEGENMGQEDLNKPVLQYKQGGYGVIGRDPDINLDKKKPSDVLYYNEAYYRTDNAKPQQARIVSTEKYNEIEVGPDGGAYSNTLRYAGRIGHAADIRSGTTKDPNNYNFKVEYVKYTKGPSLYRCSNDADLSYGKGWWLGDNTWPVHGAAGHVHKYPNKLCAWSNDFDYTSGTEYKITHPANKGTSTTAKRYAHNANDRTKISETERAYDYMRYPIRHKITFDKPLPFGWDYAVVATVNDPLEADKVLTSQVLNIYVYNKTLKGFYVSIVNNDSYNIYCKGPNCGTTETGSGCAGNGVDLMCVFKSDIYYDFLVFAYKNM